MSAACPVFEYSSRAIGVQAREIRKEEATIQDAFMRSVELGAELRAAIDALRATLEEHANTDWDGYGAAPASRLAAGHALRLIALLPIETRAPEVSADPDGDISLEWYRDRRWVFSVSVSPHGELNFAGLFGTNTIHGKEAHFEDELPLHIRAGISRVGSKAR